MTLVKNDVIRRNQIWQNQKVLQSISSLFSLKIRNDSSWKLTCSGKIEWVKISSGTLELQHARQKTEVLGIISGNN